MRMLQCLVVGKESNDLEIVEAGLMEPEDEILNTYEQDDWERVRLALRSVPPFRIREATGYSKGRVARLLRGEGKPRREQLPKLAALAKSLAGNITEEPG